MNFRFFSLRGLIAVLGISFIVSLTACTVDGEGNLIFDGEVVSHTRTSRPVASDPNSKFYSKGHYTYVNEAVLDSISGSNSRIEVDLSEQRARLYKTEGRSEKLALETQVSTGTSAHPTPTGSFRIMEKAPTKESNLYGKWIDPKTGDVLINDGDSREPPKNRNAVFRGAKMPYWLRITGSGVGLHIGYVPPGPASHGCIRVPRAIQPTLYKTVRVGTPVTIVN